MPLRKRTLNMQIAHRLRPAVLVLALLLLPLGATAASTFVVTGGQITSIQISDPLGLLPCPVGSASNCLSNAPVAIDSGSITLDFGTSTLVDLNFGASGPAVLDFGGAFGVNSVVLDDTAFQSLGASPLTGGGGAFNYGPAPGVLTTDVTINPIIGGPIFLPGVSQAFVPGGNLFVDGSGNLNLTGVSFGQLCLDQVCVAAMTDFSLQASPAIPEPSAALVFGLGAALVVAARGRSRRLA